MILPRPRKARTRIALAGAVLSAALLLLLALGARTTVRELTFRDIDEELRTLAIAVGSDYEMEGLGYEESLAKGLEANVFEFRLQNHSAILFDGDLRSCQSGGIRSHVVADDGRHPVERSCAARSVPKAPARDPRGCQ